MSQLQVDRLLSMIFGKSTKLSLVFALLRHFKVVLFGVAALLFLGLLVLIGLVIWFLSSLLMPLIQQTPTLWGQGQDLIQEFWNNWGNAMVQDALSLPIGETGE